MLSYFVEWKILPLGRRLATGWDRRINDLSDRHRLPLRKGSYLSQYNDCFLMVRKVQIHQKLEVVGRGDVELWRALSCYCLALIAEGLVVVIADILRSSTTYILARYAVLGIGNSTVLVVLHP